MCVGRVRFGGLVVVNETDGRGVPPMSNPQEPEQRRRNKGGATPQPSAELKAQEAREKGGRAHGTDKGSKGGGKGGGVPPEQQPDHP